METTLARGGLRRVEGAGRRRGLLLMAIAGGAGVGLLAAAHPSAAAAAHMDGELARLVRFMALLKAAMAAGAATAVWWRLSAPASPARLLRYLAAAAAMAAGPGVIWNLAHVGWGAILLHGGLAAALVLLWRDPATAVMIGEAVAHRRRAILLREVGGARSERAGGRSPV